MSDPKNREQDRVIIEQFDPEPEIDIVEEQKESIKQSPEEEKKQEIDEEAPCQWSASSSYV